MSTRSTIGYVKKDGSVTAVYCHYDGYPEHMVGAIEGFISLRGVQKFMSEVRRAQKKGGVRSFHPYAIETFSDAADWDCSYTREDIKEGTYEEYCYLVDSRSGEIVEFYDHEGSTLKTMRERSQ